MGIQTSRKEAFVASQIDEALDAIERELEEQDEAWASALRRIARLGSGDIAVPREFLDAIDRVTQTGAPSVLGPRA
jgi:hypothetical protein